jgi:Flp pilus assembly protein TadB
VNDQLRIGDADREAAARELGEHFAMGRITADEHGERLDQIWAARTAADLKPVFRDLPRPRPESAPRPAASTNPSRGPGPQWSLARLPFLFKVLVGIVVIGLALHHLAWVLLALLVYLFVVRRFTYRRRWSAFHSRGYARWH